MPTMTKDSGRIKKDMPGTCEAEANQCKNKVKVKLKNNAESATCNDDDSSVVLTLLDDYENPRENSQIRGARYVSLESNTLTSLPINFIETIRNIVELDLSDNELSSLPCALNTLKNLQYLNIGNNKFCTIPRVVSELLSLNSFVAKCNMLEEIPSEIGNLVNLTNLDLSFNMLTDMPATCSDLASLQHLSLMGNKFSKIPSCVSHGMHKLQVLNFSENPKAKLNIPPHSTNLTEFYAKNNGICPSFPAWILSSKYYDLEIVVLDNTKFLKVELPSAPSWSRLKKLSIRESNLWGENGKNIVSRMTHLESIDFGNTEARKHLNCFWSFPVPESQYTSQIVEVNVAQTGIPFIPKTIQDFTSLTIMDISGNNIFWLPNEICQLKNLESLIVNDNGLVCLPNDFGNIEKLREINASYNKLSEIPESIKNLKALQYFDLYDNDLLAFPEELLELKLLGLDLERNYFSTDGSLINRNIHYESTLACLRAYWPTKGKLADGQKEQILLSDLDERSSATTTPSASNSFIGECTDQGNSINCERWDVSDDSADEFDPYECNQPKERCISPLEYYGYQQKVFCPGDNHEKLIKTRINEMLQDGTLTWPVEQEGQFDDA